MSGEVPADAAEHAREFLGLLIQGRWEQALGELADGMQVDADRLGHGWTRVTDRIGHFQRMGDPATRHSGDYALVEIPMVFRAGGGLARVALDGRGEVAGVSLQTYRTHRLDPRTVGAFALRTPEAAALITLARQNPRSARRPPR